MSGYPAESQEEFVCRIESAQIAFAKQGSLPSFCKSPCKTRAKQYVGSGSGSMLVCIREKERRKRFKALLQDLMVLLPPDALQGRKSLADRIAGAADYVGVLKKRVSQLRKQTKHLQTYYDRSNTKENMQSFCTAGDVEIRMIGACSEVTNRFSKAKSWLLKYFLILKNHGLHIIGAFSSEIGYDQVLHVILMKSTDTMPVNLREALLQYLREWAPYWHSSTVVHSALATGDSLL